MSLVVRSPLVRVALFAGSLAAVAAAVMTSTDALLVLAVLLLLPIATSLSPAGRLAIALRGLRRTVIDPVVWGVPIRGRTGSGLRVESIGAVGAGLLIYLTDAGAARTLLKVAQPRGWTLEEGGVIIHDARYVQWAGKRLVRAESVPAVAIRSAAAR